MQEPMTDYQFEKLLEMVLKIIQSCSSLDEAIEQVKSLTKKGK